VVSVACASAVEAIEANIEASWVVLSSWLTIGALRVSRKAPTIESKHWVQSSRYTDCVGPGGRSSVMRKYYDDHFEANAGQLTGRVDVRASHCCCSQSKVPGV
jgi:hypothetical protein